MKMRAEARLPRGTSDVQGLSSAQMFEMNEAGLALPIDYAKIPNAQYLLPQMRYPFGHSGFASSAWTPPSAAGR